MHSWPWSPAVSGSWSSVGAVDLLVDGFVYSVALARYWYLVVSPVAGSHMALHTRLGACPQCETKRTVRNGRVAPRPVFGVWGRRRGRVVVGLPRDVRSLAVEPGGMVFDPVNGSRSNSFAREFVVGFAVALAIECGEATNRRAALVRIVGGPRPLAKPLTFRASFVGRL